MIKLYKDQKGNYHEKPSIKLECIEVSVTPKEFMSLVKQGLVYTR